MIRRKHVSFAAFSCTHCPLHSRKAVAWLLKVLADRRPDVVVMLGDLFEAWGASVHSDEHDHDTLDEYREGAALLDSVVEATPESRRVWMLGNHDDNIQRKDARRIPQVHRRALHWNNSAYSGSFLRWLQVPYTKCSAGTYQLGQVIFAHGYDAGANSNELEAIQLNNYTGGHAQRLVVRGHTHRPESVTQCWRTKRIPLPLWYANAGTLCDVPRMEYAARRDTSLWGPAVVIGEARMGRGCQPARNWGAYVMRPNGQAANDP